MYYFTSVYVVQSSPLPSKPFEFEFQMEKGNNTGSMHAVKKQAEAASKREKKKKARCTLLLLLSPVGSPITMYGN